MLFRSSEQKKEYLRSYRRHTRLITKIEQEIEEIRTLKESPSFCADGMPHGNGTSDLSSYIVRLEEKEERLRKAKFEQIIVYTSVNEQIDKLLDRDERDVLFFRYIKGWSWDKIADNMCFARSHIFRIHGNALNNLEIPER